MASASLLGVFEVVLARAVCVCARACETSLFSSPHSRIYLYHLSPKSQRRCLGIERGRPWSQSVLIP